MKRKQILLLSLLSSSIVYSQVGVNTESPKSTFHVIPTKTDGSTAEGFIAPNLTRSQLISKDSKYTAAEKGTIVYITTLDGTVTSKTSKVTTVGYYYFDGSIWQQFATSSAGIPSEPWRVQGSIVEATSNTENIYQAGKVAIGAAQTGSISPATLLVNGTSQFNDNVGIGTIPSLNGFTLSIKGNTYNSGNIHSDGTLTVGGVSALKSSTTIGESLTAADDALIVSKGKTTLNGKVGIGRAPAAGDYALVIDGNTHNSKDLVVGGNVGIGTTPSLNGFILSIKGNTYNSGNIHSDGSLTVGGISALKGNTSIGTAASGTNPAKGDLYVHGNTTIASTGSFTLKGNGLGANRYLVSDASGKGTWQALPTTATTEPWQVQGSTTPATSNTQNIYQMGSIGIGANTAVPAAYKLQVTGASNVTGNSRVGSSTVVGAQTVGTTLAVAGATTLNGTTTAKATTITGQLNYKPTAANPIANTYLRTDAAGNATWQALPATATTEPWQVQGGATLATSNAQNIYQTGSVHIGANTAVPAAYKLQVTGASNVTGNSRVGSSTVVGAQTVGTTLAVAGATTLNSTLTTVGTSALRGATTIGTTTAAANLVVNGNTGIGIAAPTQKLDVRGNEFVSGISKVGGTTTLNSSAQLELADANKGFLPNRVALTSSTVKAPVAGAVDGMMVYNTTSSATQNLSPGFYYWRGTNWQRLVDKIPVTGVRMFYQTTSVVAGPASGGDQSKMKSLSFSETGKVHAPVVLKLPEDGSYAFNVKLYSQVCNLSTGTVATPQYAGKVVVYVGIWVNNVLQDVSEVFYQISPMANGSTALNGANVTNVVLGCTGVVGDKVDIRLGYLTGSLPNTQAVLSYGLVNPTPISNRTSLVFWKL